MDYSNAIANGTGKPLSGIAGFDSAEAAPEFTPLPPGIYFARILKGEYCNTKAGADAYRMRFEVTEGKETGRTAIRTWTFSEKAMGYAKLELAPFGLTTTEKLLSPFPSGGREYLVRLVVTIRRGNDGIEWNDIKRIELLRVVDSPAAGFLLDDTSEGGPRS